MVSLAVEYPSESGVYLSGEEGGEPPPPTTMRWDLGGLPCGHAAPAQVVSLALAVSSTAEDLPACWGALLTSCTDESDFPAFTTGILGTGFSAQLLSLWQLEAATACHHASIRGRRLMVKWVEHEIHPEKSLLHMSPDHICGILAQTLTALFVIEEQIGSSEAIHLHVFQLPKDWVTLHYMHNHSHIPGECGRMGRPGQSAIVTSSIMAYFSAGVSLTPSPTSASALDSP